MAANARSLEETGPLLVPDFLIIAAIVIWGLVWLAPDLGHPSIHNWDESFHQAVARGTADNFPVPTMYSDSIYPTVLRHWWHSEVWMHKAAGVFWWAAIMIKLFGVSTAALRSSSLIAQLAVAVLIFLMGRPLAGRLISLACALSFLVLPWGWFMTQGHFVADVTDLNVTAFVTLGMAWLWWSVEKESLGFAALAGAAIGVAYLCKTFLAMAPLGVAGVWWFLGVVRFCKGPSFKQLLLLYGVFFVIAVPWNVYAYLHWQDVFMRAWNHTLGFVDANSGEDIGSGWRPLDAVFLEINFTLLRPIPYPFTFLCGVWLAVKAVKERDGRVIAIALWLWSTWAVHTYTHVKGHGHLWNVMPAVYLAYAMTLRDAYRYRPLAIAVSASLLVWYLMPQVPALVALRAKLPAKLVQSRTWDQSNVVEQFVIVPPLIVLAALLGLALRKRAELAKRLALATGLLASAGAFAYAFPFAISMNRKQVQEMDRDRQWSQSQDLGLALDPVLDKQAMFFMATNYDYGVTFEYLSLMFWSGRMCERRPPEIELALSKGHHPYLVSVAAEPFATLDQVPPYAGLRAYDLLTPAEPPPLPAGLTPLDQELRSMHAVGWAARTVNSRWSRYAFYFEPRGVPGDARVTFELADGSRVEYPLPIQGTLVDPNRLAPAKWFLVPCVGPPHEQVKTITFAQ